MKTSELIETVEGMGCRFIPKGATGLAVTNPDRIPSELVAVLRERKPEILAAIRPRCPGWSAIPPTDLPLNSIRPGPSPKARETVINYVLRQGAAGPGGLGVWMVGRENAYFDGPGSRWDCGLLAYAAARDCAQWQQGCNSEIELIDRLTGFNEAAGRSTP
jgi:hypothetical protein